MAIALDNDSSHSGSNASGAMSNEDDNDNKSKGSGFESDESDGGWSDEDGDSTGEHDDDPILPGAEGETVVAYNHKSATSATSGKKEPATASIMSPAAAAVKP